jgi:predicted dehydrogenase
MSTRWGILGTGGIAHAFADALRRTDGAELVAVASRSEERAQSFVDGHQGARAYGSYEQLLAAGVVDVVYIATPQHRHAEDAILAASHRTPAVVEKPFTLTSESAQAVRRAAEDNDVMVIEGMWTLFNPLVERLCALVESGELGVLRMFSANTGPIGVPADHRALTPELGASLLWECLVYPVAILTALAPDFATPTAIDALSLVRHERMDEATAVLLRAPGAFAEFGGAFAAGSADAAGSRARMLFDNAWVELADLYNPASLRIGWKGGAVSTYDAEADTVGFGWEIEAVGRALSGAQALPPRVQLPQTLGNIRLLESIRDAATVVPWSDVA